MPRRSLLAVFLALLQFGCGIFGTDQEPCDAAAMPIVTCNQSADFGFQAFYSRVPIPDDPDDDAQRLWLWVFSEEGDVLFTPFGQQGASVSISGVTDTETPNQPYYHAPGEEVEFRVFTSNHRIEAALTIPSISDMHLDVPDSVCAGQPVPVNWTYPEGEANDGMLQVDLVQSFGVIHTSGELDPSVTSYVLPAAAAGSYRIQARSYRRVDFPKLPPIIPADDGFGVDSPDSYILATQGGTNRVLTVLPTTDAFCTSQ